MFDIIATAAGLLASFILAIGAVAMIAHAWGYGSYAGKIRATKRYGRPSDNNNNK